MLRFISDNVFLSKGKGICFPLAYFHFDSMYGGIDTPYGSNNMKIYKKGPWMSESLENER